jgi:predicted nucleotidyltransferase
MVEQSIVVTVQKYMKTLGKNNVPVSFGVIFGSHARGEANSLSDIDLLVVSPLFDKIRQRKDINLLWRLAARIDSRIEPIPVGQNQFALDDSSAIIEIARREGQIIPLAD